MVRDVVRHVDPAYLSRDAAVYDAGVPILGICYGAQLLAQQLGGDVARTGSGEYGRTTLEMVLNTWAAHDLDHTMQAELALMQPFIPRTGHWHWEFAAKEMAVPVTG